MNRHLSVRELLCSVQTLTATQEEAGWELYDAYCLSCHSRFGKGLVMGKPLTDAAVGWG